MNKNQSVTNCNHLTCLHCEGKEFGEFIMDFPVEINGETITVESEASVCLQCNEPLMDSEQMDKLRIRSADEYKRIHGLLESHENVTDLRMQRGHCQ